MTLIVKKKKMNGDGVSSRTGAERRQDHCFNVLNEDGKLESNM